jgi:predicted nucleic acid-binding protein
VGVRDALQGKRVYFDANIFIYLMEGYAAFGPALEEIHESLSRRETEVVTSELTLFEVLIAPFRAGDAKLAHAYREFIADSGAFTLVPTTRETYVTASLYRAQIFLPPPDAIHVATAVLSGCELVVSNDRSLKTPKGLELLRF